MPPTRWRRGVSCVFVRPSVRAFRTQLTQHLEILDSFPPNLQYWILLIAFWDIASDLWARRSKFKRWRRNEIFWKPKSESISQYSTSRVESCSDFELQSYKRNFRRLRTLASPAAPNCDWLRGALKRRWSLQCALNRKWQIVTSINGIVNAPKSGLSSLLKLKLHGLWRSVNSRLNVTDCSLRRLHASEPIMPLLYVMWPEALCFRPVRECDHASVRASGTLSSGAITSKIKHAMKHKTSPARLAQLLHNCCSPHFILACSQWRRTVQDWTVRRHWLQVKTKC